MFDIITDTSANLPAQWLQENGVAVLPFSFLYDGREHVYTDTDALEGKAFYDAMRQGLKVTTSQVTPQRYEDAMRPILADGRDVLFVGMSSGVSGAFHSGQIAREQLREEFPERKICLVDTLGASLGEGLHVMEAVRLRAQGADIEAVAETLTENVKRMCQVFTVDDLKYLRATGRLSGAKAIIAGALGIKPMLKGDPQGRIVCFAKARGRRASIETMAQQYDKFVENAGGQTIGIAHADCPEDAEYLITLLRRNNPPRDILNVCYEPVTGSHVGPGALALFFMGSEDFRGGDN